MKKRKRPTLCQRHACRLNRAEIERLKASCAHLTTACNERANEIRIHSQRGDEGERLHAELRSFYSAFRKLLGRFKAMRSADW